MVNNTNHLVNDKLKTTNDSITYQISLGMEHDGNQDGNTCDQDNFIMSPTLGAGKTSWSSCSKNYLDKFLLTPQAHCVLAPSSHVNILNQFTSQDKLPGQIFDANKQCVLRFGSDSRKSQSQPAEDVCRLLRCDTGSSRNIVAYHAHPALTGTSCGNQKVDHNLFSLNIHLVNHDLYLTVV